MLQPLEIGFITLESTLLICLLLCIGLVYKRQKLAEKIIPEKEVVIEATTDVLESKPDSHREDQLAQIIET